MVEIVRVTLPGLPITLGWLNRFHHKPYYAMHPVRSTGRHFRCDKARSKGLNFRSHRGATNKELWEEAMPTETMTKWRGQAGLLSLRQTSIHWDKGRCRCLATGPSARPPFRPLASSALLILTASSVSGLVLAGLQLFHDT